MARHCSECGSTRRMVGQPEDVDLCTVCTGQERHTYDVERDPKSKWTFHKGYYNDWPTIEDMQRQPAQGVSR